MRFEFTCGLCKKSFTKGRKFMFDLWENLDDTESEGVTCEDDICTSCSRKIERKIESMRK